MKKIPHEVMLVIFWNVDEIMTKTEKYLREVHLVENGDAVTNVWGPNNGLLVEDIPQFFNDLTKNKIFPHYNNLELRITDNSRFVLFDGEEIVFTWMFSNMIHKTDMGYRGLKEGAFSALVREVMTRLLW